MSRTKVLTERLLQDRAERLARKVTNRTGRPAERAEFDPFKVTRPRVVAGGNPGYLVKTPMRRGPVGWFISCGHCGVEFESKGWRYCPQCMELPAEERREPLPSPTGPMCQCPGCSRRIPKWRGGRRVSKATRFCSAKCANRARRLSDIAPPGFDAPNSKKVPVNSGSSVPLNIIGGFRWPNARPLERGLVREILDTELVPPARAGAAAAVLLTASSRIAEARADSGIDTSIPDFLRRTPCSST